MNVVLVIPEKVPALGKKKGGGRGGGCGDGP